MKPLPPFDGPYTLEAEHARGILAMVYRAVSSTHGAVLVHMMNPRLAADPFLAGQFRKTARLLMELRHPRLGRILDVGETRGVPYYVGPVHETTLRGRLASGVLPLPEAIRIAREVGEGLAHAHPQGFVHMDIRPETIAIDPEGHAVLTGFGVAPDPDRSARTVYGSFLGVPAYMAPEQVAGLCKPFSDAYSLGVVLFEMVAGHPPFEDPDPIRLCSMQAFDPPPELRSLAPDVPEGLARLVACLLEKQAEQRVAGMGEMVAELRRIEGSGTPAESGETITLRPTPAGAPHHPPAAPSRPPAPAPPQVPPPPQERRAPAPPPKDPTWARPQSGSETVFYTADELRDLAKAKKKTGVPFWVWLIGAVILTTVITLLILQPWRGEESTDLGSTSDPPMETLATAAAPGEPVQRPVDHTTPRPPPTEPTSTETAASSGRPTEATSPEPSYDWTAPAAVLLVSATGENDQPVAASIHIDGRAVGEQTTRELMVGPGRRRVAVVRSGMRVVAAYFEGREIRVRDGTAEVMLEPGKTLRLRFVLSRS